MKKYNRIICFLLCFTLTWNSISYLANAQEDTGNEGAIEEIEQDVETFLEGEPVVEDSEEELPDEEVIEEEEEDVDTSEENEPEVQSEAIQTSVEYIKDILVTPNVANKAFAIQWVAETEYEACELIIYEHADKRDSSPVIVEVPKVIEEITDGQTGEKVNVQKFVLNQKNSGKTFENGKSYYFEVKPYVMNEQVKEYGVALEATAVLLVAPVITVTAGDAQCQVKWNAVKGATKYAVLDVQTGKIIREVTGTSVTVNKLQNSKSYKYQVRAIAEVKFNGKAYVFSSELSKQASATTKILTPAKVTGFTYEPYNLGAILKWNKASNATAYEIYRYDTKNKSKGWKKIKTVSNTTYKDTGLTKGRKYYYKIKSVRTSGGKTVYSGYADKQLTVTAKKYLTGAVQPIIYYARVRNYAPVYETKTTKTVARKLKAGTKVTIINKSDKNTRYQVRLANGKIYWIAGSRIYFYGCKYSTLDYTTNVKEDFVNSKGYSSKTKYLIWISSYTQKTNIFKGSKGKWKLYKTYKCTTGKPSTRTPKGTFKVTRKQSRYGRYTYEKYVTFWKNLNSFHTRLYRNGRIVDSRIGKPVSNGCIRLYTGDAKWIYNNIPKGTTVISN